VLDRERWTSDFRVMSTVRQPVATASTVATFVVDNRAPGAQQV
jgi:alkaline phosphatase D